MEQARTWSPTDAVARRVREVRAARGMSAQQLADALAAEGIAWQRSTVAKLENGNRENVSLTEWLALAAVLNVAPVHLLLPLAGEDAQYLATPTRAEDIERVRGWVRGHYPLPGGNVVKFQDEMPEEERGVIHVPPSQGRGGKVTIEGLEETLTQVTAALRTLRESDDGKHR
ncbi:helix-turn-helix domain-containing protein [Streptomyces zhihengii]